MATGAQSDVLNLTLPTRPRMMSHQSNSLPSTPRQLPREYVLGSRTPSPGCRAGSNSPRSVASDSNRPMPALRLAPATCRFMSTQTSRRRIPYTIGTDPLQIDEERRKVVLDPHDEEKLSRDMKELYNQLLPSRENEAKREQVVEKLRKILADEWPGKEIEVSMFGSSGNLLFTGKSDVDVCVTMRDIEATCLIADALARHGMQKVTCVHAKAVPIVKVWDPELQLACDLNLNNNVALTNTRMVKTYVQIDERVRPLAMIVKHWTKRRIINEASGGTLSSYTWTLLLINFLQTRRPPILPVLSIRDQTGMPRNDFSQDLELLRGFGVPNKETLGELLFNFFHRYGYEIDYRTAVVSVRKGKLLTKEEKNWQLATNNMLCVEEPFNNERNLGNTADDTAFRGLHLEFRQAFERLVEAKDIVTSVCEQFRFPSGDTKPVIFERPQAQPRPVITRSRSQSNRGGGNNGSSRGNRHQNNQRSGLNGRRASSATDYSQNVHPIFQGNPQILFSPTDYLIRNHGQDHQQHIQSQQGIQDQLSRLSQQLSQEEHRLRAQQMLITQAQLQQAQAQAQAQVQAQVQTQTQTQTQIQAHAQAHITAQNRSNTFSGRVSSSHSYRSPQIGGTDDPPLSAPLQRNYNFGLAFESPAPSSHSPSQQGTDTNPSSPQLTPSIPLRRNFQRATGPASASAAIRSHSQPPRSIGQHGLNSYPRAQYLMATSSPQGVRQEFVLQNGVQGQSFIGPFMGPYGPFYIPATSLVEPIPREYLGYGYVASPQLLTGYTDRILPLIPAFNDLRQQEQSSSDLPGLDPPPLNMVEPSRSSSPLDVDELYINGVPVQNRTQTDHTHNNEPYLPTIQATFAGPVIVNGSKSAMTKTPETQRSFSTQRRRASDSFGNFGHSFAHGQASSCSTDDVHQRDQTILDTTKHRDHLGMLLNGHASSMENDKSPLWTPSTLCESKAQNAINGHAKTVPSTPAATSPPSRLSPESQIDRRIPSGNNRPMISSLDLGTNNYDLLRENIHPQSTVLSPVRETPTPSPTSSRRIERGKDGAHINGGLNGTLALATSQPNSKGEQYPSASIPVLNPTGSGIGAPDKQEHRKETVVADERKPLRPYGGNVAPPSVASNNAWQLAAGKKRKARITNPWSASGVTEPMPLDQAERKGG